ncbi:MAG: hypothetical protein JRF07_03915, partial [Deltaproteobacteria bacterium]|nr:hypothetical protein [Deltaproteobacteria bacterium]
MKRLLTTYVLATLVLTTLFGCASHVPLIPVDDRSVSPGESITRGGKTTLQLLGDPVSVGGQLPDVTLVDINLKSVDLKSQVGDVLLISIVPSVDTDVCERQTHILGEESEQLSPAVKRITISRDL